MSRARNVCFTVNNYDALLDPSMWPGCTYCVYSEEVGENGTSHLQGYMEFAGAKSYSSLHAYEGLEDAHFEVRRGTQKQAIDYCLPTKGNIAGVVDPTHLGGPYVYGEPKKQGERTDLSAVSELCMTGKASIRQVAELDPSAFIRYSNGITKLHAMYQLPRPIDVGTTCFVFYGSGGVGKTTTAMRIAQYVAGSSDRVYMLSARKGSGLYWDNYRQGDVVIIDEFNGSRMTPTDFNRLIDKGPCPIPIHGNGSIQFNSPLVIITTNVTPREWWPNVSFQRSLRRRITIWPIFRSLSWKSRQRRKIDGVSEVMAYSKVPGDLDVVK